ncbi:MAG: metal ABC transporter permease [Actinomycetota bacterium]
MGVLGGLWTGFWSACPFEFCRWDFMHRALVAAALVGLAAPAIGIFLVQRRLSLMGDGIGHVAFTGVAAGFLFGVLPLVTAIVAAVIGALAIELMRARGRTQGDVALAVVFYGGIAGGALLMGLAGTSNTNTLTYLFGALLTVDPSDILAALAICVIVLATTTLFRRVLFAVSYDEEVARISGVPVRTVNILIAVAAAVTVGVTMRVVGILLVSGMLVLPVAAVQQLTRNFNATFVGSLALGLFVSIAGVVTSYYVDAPPGATIVMGAIVAFVLATVFARARAAV